MNYQIEGFNDNKIFTIIKGVLYKIHKYNKLSYIHYLLKNIPYNKLLEEEAYGFDDIGIKLIINKEQIKINKDTIKSLNYKDNKYFDASIPCKKNKKLKIKSLLSEKKIKKNKIKKDKKNKNVLKQKKIKYKNECLMYGYIEPKYWLNINSNIGTFDIGCYEHCKSYCDCKF